MLRKPNKAPYTYLDMEPTPENIETFFYDVYREPPPHPMDTFEGLKKNIDIAMRTDRALVMEKITASFTRQDNVKYRKASKIANEGTASDEELLHATSIMLEHRLIDERKELLYYGSGKVNEEDSVAENLQQMELPQKTLLAFLECWCGNTYLDQGNKEERLGYVEKYLPWIMAPLKQIL